MKILKKLISSLLVACFILGIFPSFGITAAASTSSKAYLVKLPTASETYTSGWGSPSLDLLGGWSIVANKKDASYLHGIGSTSGVSAYCIEPGIGLNSGDVFAQKDETYWDNYPSNLNPTLSPTEIKVVLGRILQYGYLGDINRSWDSANPQHANEIAHSLATQLLVWEAIVGERDMNFQHVNGNTQGKDNVSQYITANHPLKDLVFSYYHTMESQIQSHTLMPSFVAASSNQQSYELKWDGSAYSTTLADEHDVLAKYSFHTSTEGVDFTTNGNQLTISTTTNPKGKISISATKDSSKRMGVFVWSDGVIGGGRQNTITHSVTVSDPVEGSFYVEIKTGNLQLIKTSEDNLVSDISFLIEGNDISTTMTTDANGEIHVTDLPVGNYTITETSPVQYVPLSSQTVSIQSGQTASVSFHNTLKKFNVAVTKTDSEYGEAQGDGSLSGAVYGIYNNGELVDTYSTDATGSFVTDYYVCGNQWTLKEITPPEGYLLDETVHTIGSDPTLYTVEQNLTSNAVQEQVIKGSIRIIKHSNNGDTQIETPEVGAEFEVYLKSNESYELSPESERDYLVCDEYGYAETKSLPYGIYTVHQTSGWEGVALLPAFDVFIHENGAIYPYIINNANFESHIKIEKRDSETDNIIPLSGTGFQIYDPEGTLITMDYSYPTPTTIDTFYTNAEGYLITPESLPYGNGYTLVEVQAPYGYILDSTPISFDVNQPTSDLESGLTVITVAQTNLAQKGIISIKKEGEHFSSVHTSGELFQPMYTSTGLGGAVYEIVAGEDIYTMDGTLRAEKGTIVSTLTTNSEGLASSDPLYLGKYVLTELTAPNGYVLDSTPREVELVYEGQNISLTDIEASFYNERQKLVVNVTKTMEQDSLYQQTDEAAILDVQFGLYAREDIIASDGSLIPAGGLIELLSMPLDGVASFNTDLPFGNYYVQEITTNEAYILDDSPNDITFEYVLDDSGIAPSIINENISIENKIILGTVSLTKISAIDPEMTLEGALFEIFSDDNKNAIFDEGDSLVSPMTELSNGNHILEQLPYGCYFVKEHTAPNHYVLDDASYYFQITESDAQIEIMNNPDFGFSNAIMTGHLQINKTSSDGILEGFTFLVEGTDILGQSYCEEFVTDSNGQIIVTDLVIGNYTVSELETDASKSYILPEPQSTEVIYNEASVLDFYNEKIQEQINPKTGDDSPIMLWGIVTALALVSIISIGGIYAYTYSKKSNSDKK